MTRTPFAGGPYAGLWGLGSVLAARRQAGLPPPHSQAELAAQLGYHPDSFSRLVRGRAQTGDPLALVAAICAALACTPEALQPPLLKGGPTLTPVADPPVLAGTPGRVAGELRLVGRAEAGAC